MSPDNHPKDPNVSQYLNYVASYACLQELKRIPDHKMRRAECKDQGTEHKTQDGNGVSCAKKNQKKDHAQNSWMQQEE